MEENFWNIILGEENLANSENIYLKYIARLHICCKT